MTDNNTVGEAVPVAQRGSWSSFLKSIASFSGDLSSLTAPPFILSPVSLTEFPAYWCEHPHIFAAIADAPDDESRALAVLKWFIASLNPPNLSRPSYLIDRLSSAHSKASILPEMNQWDRRKSIPLNPVLGELFYGWWPPSTTLLVEQVSHHPPITAYLIENKSKGLRLQGHNAQKTSFSGGSIIVKQIGHAILTYTPPDPSKKPVEYLLTLPRLRIDGLWYGSPYIELSETSYIVGGGFISTVEYKGKGYFSGKSHSFKATLVNSPTFTSHNVEHHIEGTWHERSKFSKSVGRAKSSDSAFHDLTNDKRTEVIALGGDGSGAMGPFETRKLWLLVAKGIRESDFETASKEKTKIENDARQRRRDEAAAGTSWPLKHFKHVENDPIYERLARLVPGIAPPKEDCYAFLENWPKIPELEGNKN